MSSRNRGVVSDYAGEPLYVDDLIAYSARQGNTVRMADAIVRKVTVRHANVEGVGRVMVPVLLVEPTGAESGFVARTTMRKEWIQANHVRLVERGESR